MLEVLICTIDEGIENVPSVLLPPRSNVCYLVSWQHAKMNSRELPVCLCERTDVRVFHLLGKGLSANRNHALSKAKGDVLLIADDDVSYRPEYFDNIMKAFELHPEASIICFQAIDEAGKAMRVYSANAYKYEERPYGSYVCSWEIALRNRPDIPRFDERFGLGSSYLACGEEEIFVEMAARQGLSVWYEPIPIVRTNRQTTGMKFSVSPAVQRSKGAVLYVIHGFWGAVMRCVKYALLMPGTFQKLKAFANMWNGIRYIQRTGI